MKNTTMVLVVAIMCMFLVALVAIMGNVYTTKFAFNAVVDGKYRHVKLEDWQVVMCKVSTIMNWVLLGLVAAGFIVAAIRIDQAKTDRD